MFFVQCAQDLPSKNDYEKYQKKTRSNAVLMHPPTHNTTIECSECLYNFTMFSSIATVNEEKSISTRRRSNDEI